MDASEIIDEDVEILKEVKLLEQKERRAIREFCKEANIKKLYNVYHASIQNGKDEPAAQLLKNCKEFYDRRKDSLNVCLPSTKSNNRGSFQEEKFLKFIGRFVVDRLGDETINPYKGSLVIRKNYHNDLFIWALLMNKMKLSRLLWKKGTNYICSALFASALMKALSRLADSEDDTELSNSFIENASYFERLACDLVTVCFKINKRETWGLLVNPIDEYGGITILEMSARNELMEFMGNTACQSKLNAIWEGQLAHFTTTTQILLCIFVPFLIPTITFVRSSDKSDTAIYHQVKWTGLKSKDDSISIYRAIYCFYTAPVTKFWACVVSHILFLIFFGFIVLTNLYPLSTKDLPKLEFLILGWTLTIFIEEIRQVLNTEKKSLLGKLRSWCQSSWNKFDAVMYLVFILAFILRFSLSAGQFIWARMAYSISLAIFILRTMQYFFVARTIGPKVIMIGKMVSDMKFFLMIFAVVLFSFGVVVQANQFPNSPPTWKLITDIVYIPYWQIFGELFLDNMEGKEPSICTFDPNLYINETLPRCAESNAMVPLCLAVYMVVTNLLLVNLLIAMFSDTFQKVHNNSLLLWKFYRYHLVCEYQDRPSLFPPLIFLNHVFRVIVYFCDKLQLIKEPCDNPFKIKMNNIIFEQIAAMKFRVERQTKRSSLNT